MATAVDDEGSQPAKSQPASHDDGPRSCPCLVTVLVVTHDRGEGETWRPPMGYTPLGPSNVLK
jgi:hypothetical protein